MSPARWVLLVALLAPTAAPAAKPQLPKLAVFDIKGLQGVSADTAAIINEIVTTEVSRLKRWDVVSQTDVSSLLGLERQKQLLGCSDNNGCLAQIGGALGVELLLNGQVAKFGSRYRLSLVLLDVRKAKVIAREGAFCENNEDALANAIQQVVAALFKAVPAAPPAEPAVASKPPPTPEPAKVEPPKPAPEPVVEAPAAAVEPAAEVRESAPGSGKRTAAWIVGGGAVLLLVGGGAFDALAHTAYVAEVDASKAGNGPDYLTNREAALSNGRYANILYGVGAVAAGTAAYLFLTSDSGATSVSAMPTRGGAFVQLRSVFP